MNALILEKIMFQYLFLFSGPKRYDYVNESWIYLHTGENMNDLLSEEFSEMLKREIDCTHLNYGLQT